MSAERKVTPLHLRTAYTTGHVAHLCGVATRTVTNWCDTGKIPYYRVPGPGNHRRVTRDDVAIFMSLYGIPMPPWLTVKCVEGNL